MIPPHPAGPADGKAPPESTKEHSGQMKSNSRALAALAAIVGVLLVILAVVYWVRTADALPGWLPGHDQGSTHHHVKHGIAAFFVGAACLVYAWFQTGSGRPGRPTG